MIDIKELKNVHKDYMSGLRYKDIEEKHKITHSELIYIIQKNKWKRKRVAINKGNKNAKGNKGGPGTPKGEKRALKTGEYETIFKDTLNEDEQYLYQQCEIRDKTDIILDEFRLLTIRERRMLMRIKKINDSNKDLTINNIRKRKKDTAYKSDDEIETITEAELTIEVIQRIEEALTRVQDAKRKCLETLHKMETDDRKLELELIRLEREVSKESNSFTENIKDDSFIEALNSSTESAWNDYEEK